MTTMTEKQIQTIKAKIRDMVIAHRQATPNGKVRLEREIDKLYGKLPPRKWRKKMIRKLTSIKWITNDSDVAKIMRKADKERKRIASIPMTLEQKIKAIKVAMEQRDKALIALDLSHTER